jgi:hypothetical protein
MTSSSGDAITSATGGQSASTAVSSSTSQSSSASTTPDGAVIGTAVINWCNKKKLGVHSIQEEPLLESFLVFS